MTALELIKQCAEMLSIDEITEDSAINTITSSNEATVLKANSTLQRLFEILKIELTEIANSYAPIVREKEMTSSNKEISLTGISNVIKILSVKKDDVLQKFQTINGVIKLPEDGKYTVKYTANPNVYSLINNIDFFNDKVSSTTILYGLNAYYCLAMGLFNEFNIYNEMYMDQLKKVTSLRVFDLPFRRV